MHDLIRFALSAYYIEQERGGHKSIRHPTEEYTCTPRIPLTLKVPTSGMPETDAITCVTCLDAVADELAKVEHFVRFLCPCK